MITLQIKKKNKIYFAGDFHLGKPDKDSSLSREKKISAVVGFSGGFLNVKNKVSKINLDTPILLVHGDEDNVVPMEMTKMAKKNLNILGYFVNTYFSKGLGHGISLDGLAESTKFLKNLGFEIYKSLKFYILSYPRSGNHLLRLIICLRVHTAIILNQQEKILL